MQPRQLHLFSTLFVHLFTCTSRALNSKTKA